MASYFMYVIDIFVRFKGLNISLHNLLSKQLTFVCPGIIIGGSDRHSLFWRPAINPTPERDTTQQT